MSFAIFSANKSVTGGALIVNSEANGLFFSVFKQVANNPDNKKGNFNFSDGLKVKFSEAEAGEMIHAIRTHGEFKFFHTTKDSKSTGKLAYYEIEAKGDFPARRGFGLSITKGDLTVKVGVSIGDAECLMEYLRLHLHESMNAAVAESRKKNAEYVKNLAAKKKVQNKQTEVEQDDPAATSDDNPDF